MKTSRPISQGILVVVLAIAIICGWNLLVPFGFETTGVAYAKMAGVAGAGGWWWE
jgi:hypothetical protein